MISRHLDCGVSGPACVQCCKLVAFEDREASPLPAGSGKAIYRKRTIPLQMRWVKSTCNAPVTRRVAPTLAPAEARGVRCVVPVAPQISSRSQASEQTELSAREAHQELLDRVLGSAEFRRSVRLREFLRYVGGRALAGASHIHEQEIGTEVFERRADYDTSLDNIVRVNATLLRRRMEAYFAGEGRDERTVILIAKGGYLPVFAEREGIGEPDAILLATESAAEAKQMTELAGDLPDALEPAPALAALHAPVRTVPLVWFSTVAAAAVLLLIGCVMLLALRRPAPALMPLSGNSVRDLFWRPFLQGAGQTDLVLGDTSFALTQDLLDRDISLKNFIGQHYAASLNDPALSLSQQNDLRMLVSRNNGSMAEFRFASELFRLAGKNRSLALLSAREFNPADLDTRDVILMGSRKSNPWVQVYDDELNFSFRDNSGTVGSAVVNRHPRPGEPVRYVLESDSSAYSGFCVIAFLRNPAGTGDVLLLEGSGSEETQAAGEFLVSEPAMDAFARQIGRPALPHFELLLRTRKLPGAPLRSDVVAYRLF